MVLFLSSSKIRDRAIKDGIDDAPQRVGLSPSRWMAAGDKEREQRPFGIIEIAGVETGIYSGVPQPSNSPHPPH
jgi:hypothetical protein